MRFYKMIITSEVKMPRVSRFDDECSNVIAGVCYNINDLSKKNVKVILYILID